MHVSPPFLVKNPFDDMGCMPVKTSLDVVVQGRSLARVLEYRRFFPLHKYYTDPLYSLVPMEGSHRGLS